MTDIVTIRRQLRIKSGVVDRLFKETKLYRDEVEELENRKIDLITKGAEEWDIKNASRMTDESNRMVVDARKRLKTAKDDLVALITEVNKEGKMSQDEELINAECMLKGTETLVLDEGS